jgi:pentatricopeptide repeat protein
VKDLIMKIYSVTHQAYDGCDSTQYISSYIRAGSRQEAFDIYSKMQSLPKYQKYPYFWSKIKLEDVKDIESQIINK